MAEASLNFQIQTRLTQFRIPSELIKINFKSIQKLIEKQKKQFGEEVNKIKGDCNLTAKQKLAIINKLIRNFESFQRKLRISIDKDQELRLRLIARKENVQKLKQFEAHIPQVQDKISGSDEEEKEEEEEDPKEKPALDDILLDLHNPNLINWYRNETNLLIVDYLIKSNTRTDENLGLLFLKSLEQKNPNINQLIDYDLYETFNKIFISIIRYHDLSLIINWFNENKIFLKKANSNLEFEINYCKFLSLVDKGDVSEAVEFSKNNLSSFGNLKNYQEGDLSNLHKNVSIMKDIGGLMVYLSTKVSAEYSTRILRNSARYKEYKLLLSDERWISLSQCFLDNFTKLYGIPKNYPLFIYLSAGLTSLKTKSCFCNQENTIFKDSSIQSDDFYNDTAILEDPKYRVPSHYYKILKKINNCPVCSPELFTISKNLPYAQLITSIFNNPYKLPNGNIYPYDKLLTPNDQYLTEKSTLLRQGKIKDPLTKQLCLIEECVRVYPA